MKNTVNQILGNLKASISAEGIPFMEGREPGKLVPGEVVTIVDYGFINGEDGKYSVFVVKEDEKHFFFGGLVFNQLFEGLDFYSDEEIKAVLEHGIEVTTEVKKSKKGREYTKVVML